MGDSRVVDLEPHLYCAALPGLIASVIAQFDVIARACEGQHMAGVQLTVVRRSRLPGSKCGPARLGKSTELQIIGAARGVMHDQPRVLATWPVGSEVRCRERRLLE